MIINFASTKAGEKITGYFVIRKIDYKVSREKKDYISLELGNKYGRVKAVLWDGAKDFREKYNERDIVKIRGTVTSFGDIKQIKVEKVREIQKDDAVDKEDLIPHTECDIDELKNKIFEFIDSISNSFLKELLNKYFTDEQFLSDYLKAPAGKLWHHTYIGGLAEHSVSVAEICEKTAEIHPSVDKDLLITGALLHDIGKTSELTAEGFIDYTDEGRLIGHIVLQAVDCSGKIDEIPEFPQELKNRIIHMLVSHQGEKEKGSPVVPQTLEGMILHYADELDSQSAAFERIEKKEKEPGKKWSSYVNLKDRYFFFGEEKDNK